MTISIQFECEWDEIVFSLPQTVVCHAEIEPAGQPASRDRPGEPAAVQHIEAFALNSLGHRVRIDPIPAGLYRDLEEGALQRYSELIEETIANVADREHKEKRNGRS